MWEAQYYHHDAPRSLITSGGLGTMGFALPAAIGVKRARPEAEVWAVVGDGGFQMTMCELATAVQDDVQIKVAIINNGFLGMVRQWQEFFYERRYAATPLSGPDFVKLADAFGILGLRASSRAEVQDGADPGARPSRPGGHRLPSGAGRHRLPDGSGWRRPSRHDPPPQSDRRNRRGLEAERHDNDAYVRDLRRGPAGRPQPRRLALPAARIQHSLAHGRAQREPGHFPDDGGGTDRCRRCAADHGSPLQAGERPERRRHHQSCRPLRQGPRAHQGLRRSLQPRLAAPAHAGLRGPRRRRRRGLTGARDDGVPRADRCA